MRMVYRISWAILSLLFIALVPGKLFSQVNINDAIGAYNGGLQVMQSGEFEAALDSFKHCISIAKELGEEGDGVKVQAENQLPIVNYEIGRKLASNKEYDKAIEQFKETIDIAKAYGSEEDVQRITTALGQVYYFQGTSFYKDEKFNDALDMFNKAVEINPDNSKALYMIAISYKNLGDDDKLRDAAKKAMEAAKADKDNRLAESSMKLGRDYFLVKANKSKDLKKYDEALKYLQISLEFDNESSATYYLMTQIYGLQTKWDDAISAANKGLEFENTDPSDQAKFYYAIGNAYKEKGENEKACDAFKKALVGPFKESSEYQIQHVLKCG